MGAMTWTARRQSFLAVREPGGHECGFGNLRRFFEWVRPGHMSSGPFAAPTESPPLQTIPTAPDDFIERDLLLADRLAGYALLNMLDDAAVMAIMFC